ncbi:MAG: hypothetical protein GY789_02700 [Hyphomicrobiales bacterium]|nr:hypothetical protein [Hyphomicrobiales bacterium]MCP5001080.1 hypothetical protein [Hyphomicrobiales bacterium]
MHPMQDSSDLGRLVRRIGRRDTKNVIELHSDGCSVTLSAEEALVSWMLDLPDGAAITKAARYALRHADAGSANSAEVERFCGYLRQAMMAAGRTQRIRRGGRRRRRS